MRRRDARNRAHRSWLGAKLANEAESEGRDLLVGNILITQARNLKSKERDVRLGRVKTHAAKSSVGYQRTAGAPRALKRERDLWFNEGQLCCRHCDILLGNLSDVPRILRAGEKHLQDFHLFTSDNFDGNSSDERKTPSIPANG